MTDTATALSLSRVAHKAKDFQLALDERLKARALDPDRRDPSWLDDALAPPRQGVIGKQYHRMPGKTLAEVAALKDVELEVFFRQRLGEQANPVIEVSRQLETRVLVPERWETQQAGITPCANCWHREDQHLTHQLEEGVTEECAMDGCVCVTYIASLCRHAAFEPTGDKTRRCAHCGELQTLVPTMAVEDTLAYQQAVKESQR